MWVGIVYQKNKKTGITYVYQNEPYWDKEKQQSRAKGTFVIGAGPGFIGTAGFCS
jgi:hypothetical protein